jgi:hypothetical protein
MKGFPLSTPKRTQINPLLPHSPLRNRFPWRTMRSVILKRKLPTTIRYQRLLTPHTVPTQTTMITRKLNPMRRTIIQMHTKSTCKPRNPIPIPIRNRMHFNINLIFPHHLPPNKARAFQEHLLKRSLPLGFGCSPHKPTFPELKSKTSHEDRVQTVLGLYLYRFKHGTTPSTELPVPTKPKPEHFLRFSWDITLAIDNLAL